MVIKDELMLFQGPFVHVASIVANLLGKLTSFKAVYEVSVMRLNSSLQMPFHGGK